MGDPGKKKGLLSRIADLRIRISLDKRTFVIYSILRGLVLLAVWAGALPLVHTHSFLAIGLASLGCMLYDWIMGDPHAMMIRRKRQEKELRCVKIAL